jgi:hypothetical protein
MTALQNAGTPPDARADRAPLHRDRRHPAVTLATFFVSHLTPFGSARRRSLAGRNPSIIFFRTRSVPRAAKHFADCG